MPMILAGYVTFIVIAGIVSIVAGKSSARPKRAIPIIIGIGTFVALVLVLTHFREGQGGSAVELFSWPLMSARMLVGFDSLTAFFLVPLLILSACSALYGPQYLANHPAGRFHWFYFSLLMAGMAAVLLARNAVFFLLAWEVMSLSSFLLVITDRKKLSATRAGWIYFITAHIGTAFLFVLFFVLSKSSGSFDFASWEIGHISSRQADLVFVLALVAFGLKAGFMPFHVWLPLAHPEAPSHVSALMSGIMIKMGIYGILRILTVIAPFHAWWGGLLIGLGAVSGVLGVLFAIGQHDIKRLLAYHSVENIGIILLGLGIGVIGTAYGIPLLALFGFAGGLLHVVNHALFKGLLFLGAGAIIRQTGITEIDRLGGLIKRMPATAVLFLAGSVAICGLPFFNGFISELLIYAGCVSGSLHSGVIRVVLAGSVAALSLALIGGLAAACFTKVFGTVFLGAPRQEFPNTGEAPASMVAAMGVLGGCCLFIGVGSVFVMPFVVQTASMVAGAGASGASGAAGAGSALVSLTTRVSLALAAIIGATLLIAAFMRLLTGKQRRAAAESVTWDCGYVRPVPSMQYTASSFAAPLTGYFARPLAGRRKLSADKELFPAGPWHFHSSVNDWFLDRVFVPAFRFCDRVFSSLRWFQNGKTGIYVAYIALTICLLIVWKVLL